MPKLPRLTGAEMVAFLNLKDCSCSNSWKPLRNGEWRAPKNSSGSRIKTRMLRIGTVHGILGDMEIAPGVFAALLNH